MKEEYGSSPVKLRIKRVESGISQVKKMNELIEFNELWDMKQMGDG